jgi:hypothetical protein
MNQVAILYPVFVQVLLTLAVGGAMAVARIRAIAAFQQENPGASLRQLTWPDDAAKCAANYANLFELPVLFYAVVAFALITGGADLLMIVLAWLFVIARIVHSAIHIGPNKIRWRSPVFGLGFLIIGLMWLKLFLHVITRGAAG